MVALVLNTIWRSASSVSVASALPETLMSLSTVMSPLPLASGLVVLITTLVPLLNAAAMSVLRISLLALPSACSKVSVLLLVVLGVLLVAVSAATMVMSVGSSNHSLAVTRVPVVRRN